MDGLKDGLGTLFGSDGSIVYQGEWKQDVYHGRGKVNNKKVRDRRLRKEMFLEFEEVRENWRYYEGEFKEGKRCGLGVMVFANNEKYQGHFKDDVFHGTGSAWTGEKELLIQGFWQKG